MVAVLVASDDLLREQSYLVARGVRPVALAGHLHVEEDDDLLRIATQVERAACDGCLPFLVTHGNGTASYGYAVGRWALDLYEWAVRDPHVPEEQRDRIVGMLLGHDLARLRPTGDSRAIRAVHSDRPFLFEPQQQTAVVAVARAIVAPPS